MTCSVFAMFGAAVAWALLLAGVIVLGFSIWLWFLRWSPDTDWRIE